MILKKLLHFIIGYVRIAVEGYFVERFINICISKKIYLAKMKREKSTILYTDIGISDFKKVRKIAKNAQCKIKIIEKKGLPFIFKKYKKRKIFALLLGLVFCGILILSQYIWNIEIITESDLDRQELIEQLKENGLEIGERKKNIETKKVVEAIRLQRDDIAWIGIKLEGTNAIVEVIEATEKPDVINADEFCNIVSDKEGIIRKINVQNGTALVEEGDMVKKGNMLVGGYLEGKYTGTRYVHATAEIEATVWHSKKERVYCTQEIEVETGKEEKKYKINIHNFQINFYKTLSKFENYDTIVETKKLTLFRNFYLPISIEKQIHKEKEKKIITYGKAELKEKTIAKLEEELEKEIEDLGKVENKQVNYYEGKDYIEVEVIYEVRENIGAKEKIIF